MPGEFDIDEPVELAIRGDMVDVGGVVAWIAEQTEDADAADRAARAAMDFVEKAEKQINVGHLERELKRLKRRVARGDADIDTTGFRGFDVHLRSFDPRHPEPNAPAVERLRPLDDGEWYAVFKRSDKGFEAAGHPEQLDVEASMLLASFLRQYARDLEEALADTNEPSYQ